VVLVLRLTVQLHFARIPRRQEAIGRVTERLLLLKIS
jgi:hypothetical protein